MPPVRREKGERLDCVLGREEVGDAARLQRFASLVTIDRTEPRGHHRLALATRHRGDGTRGIGRADRRPRHVQCQHGVDTGIGERRCDRRGEALRWRLAAHVDGVAAQTLLRQHRVQCVQRRLPELGEPHATLDRAVGREKRGTAAVGDDREAVAARDLAHRQDARRGKELRVGAHADRAGATHGGVEDGIRREALGDVVGRIVRAAGLQHDHGLGPRSRAQRRDEAPCVAHRLHVEQDAVGGRVDEQAVEHLAEIDVDAGAERDHVREADAHRRGEVEHRRAHRAGLRDERKAAGHDGDIGDRRVEPDVGAYQPERARADQPDAVLRRDLPDVARPAPLVCRVPGRRLGDDDRGAELHLGAALEHGPQNARRRDDHREVDVLADGREALVGLAPQHLAVIGIDREELAAELAAEDVLEHDAAHRAGSLRRADERHGGRHHQRPKVVMQRERGHGNARRAAGQPTYNSTVSTRRIGGAARRGDAHGPVAQRLEQGTHNPLVAGSNPAGPTLLRGRAVMRPSRPSTGRRPGSREAARRRPASASGTPSGPRSAPCRPRAC